VPNPPHSTLRVQAIKIKRLPKKANLFYFNSLYTPQTKQSAKVVMKYYNTCRFMRFSRPFNHSASHRRSVFLIVKKYNYLVFL
jgi:hypothetical protein